MKKPSTFMFFRRPTKPLEGKLVVINGELRVKGNARCVPKFPNIENGTEVVLIQHRGFMILWNKIQAVRAMFAPYNGEGK